jgi:hypothetical protein
MVPHPIAIVIPPMPATEGGETSAMKNINGA